ncbi:MAG: hypothetical protein ACRD0N_12625 [Acidimicrobiales bacterium]
MNPAQVAEAYHLVGAGGRYRWLAGRREVMSAAWRQHGWDVVAPGRDPALVSLVPALREGRTRIALVDHERRRATTFVAAEPMTRAQIGTVHDSWGHLLLQVRADGPTGLHLITPDGRLLSLSSRNRGRDSGGHDVLVTPAGAELGTSLLFGVTLALELLRAGALRRVA